MHEAERHHAYDTHLVPGVAALASRARERFRDTGVRAALSLGHRFDELRSLAGSYCRSILSLLTLETTTTVLVGWFPMVRVSDPVAGFPTRLAVTGFATGMARGGPRG